mgnify:CR=1 FL=1
MNLRLFIMSCTWSSVVTFVSVFNANVLIIGHKLGVALANFIGIDPYIAISAAGAGIACDVMLILFISVVIIELMISEKVCIALDNFDTLLWKLLKY